MAPLRLLACLLVALTVAGSDRAAYAEPDVAEPDWRTLLERAVEAGRERAYEGRMVVVSLEPQGPTIAELAVVQDDGGAVMTDRRRSWMVGRSERGTVLTDHQTDTLLRIGSTGRTGFSLRRLADKYDVEVAGTEHLPWGTAWVLTLRRRGSDRVAERLYVDQRSDLIVRRESFSADGTPFRLTAFTDLDLSPSGLPEIAGSFRAEVQPAQAPVTGQGLTILRDLGWLLPPQLPGAFDLVDASAVGQGERSSLHLLYADGLYHVSVFQQHGRVDAEALRAAGAEEVRVGGRTVLRLPGTEPAAYVWGGGDLTFTAIGDVPPDQLGEALSAFPHDGPTSLPHRLRRGLVRVVDWLWPFA